MLKIFIGCLSLLVLTSCTAGIGPRGSSESQLAPENYEGTIASMSKTIKNSPEFADCMSPAVNMCINSVGAQLAQKAKSVTICDELPGLEQQNGCRFAVVMSEAQEQNNPNLCDTLSDEYRNTCKNEAYRTQAIMSKDIILCDRLQEDSASGTVSGNKKDQCILSVLLLDESTRPESCERINDPSLREMCSESTKK